MARIDNLRLIGISGTNKVMTGELSRLARRAVQGLRVPTPKKQGLGAIVYPFSRELAEVAVSYHRTCSRVLWDLFESSARRLEPLYDELASDVAKDERGWLWDGASISIRARNVQSFAAGERQVVGTVKNAIVDGAAKRGMSLSVDPHRADVEIAVRMHDGVISVSVDLAGGPMHQRGYREETGDAPLRENLAAVLLMLARYDSRRDVLIDPMAGSGTIAIEAALMARADSLWTEVRQPAYLRLPEFEDSSLRVLPLFGDAEPVILASDIDTRVVESMRDNAVRAGVAEDICIVHADMRDLSPKVIARHLGERLPKEPKGLILSNPPYGERLRGGEEELYDDLGHWCESFPGYRAAFLMANPEFEEIFGGVPRIRKPIKNGNLRAYFCLYDL